MPIRDYTCRSCNHEWEEIRKDQSDPNKCPKCGSNFLDRKLAAPGAFEFKGSGFYKTDFKNK